MSEHSFWAMVVSLVVLFIFIDIPKIFKKNKDEDKKD
jgi:hypothetical protein